MERIRKKLAIWAEDRWLVRAATAVAAAFVLLFACLCISIYMQMNIQHRYARTVRAMQEQTFQELSDMSELFARVNDPGVDVRYKLIPELKAEYFGASALNTALAQNFGESEAVLTPEQTAAFDEAFEEYSAAYRQGIATGLAQADMTACMNEVQQMLDDRYLPKPEPTEPVVIIDGSSGTIAKQ